MEKTKILSLASVWNQAAIKENRPLKPRDYIYASELGGAFYDRWHKMKGREPLTPPNDRSLRKFFAGNVWEFVVKVVLQTCGLCHQEEITANDTPFSGLLGVHGRIDFIVDGKIDKERGLSAINSGLFPDFLKSVAEKIITENDGVVFRRKVLELKSCSLYVYDYVVERGAPLVGHAFQAYHYQRATGIPSDVVYVSKDTALIAQFATDAELMEPAYKKDIELMTQLFERNEPPPLEPLLGFDMTSGKFKKNVGVEWSNYLHDYGYKTPEDYRRAVDPTILRWNNTLSRYAKIESGMLTPTGKPMKVTPKNEEVKKEISNSGYDWHSLMENKMRFVGVEEDLEDVD